MKTTLWTFVSDVSERRSVASSSLHPFIIIIIIICVSLMSPFSSMLHLCFMKTDTQRWRGRREDEGRKQHKERNTRQNKRQEQKVKESKTDQQNEIMTLWFLGSAGRRCPAVDLIGCQPETHVDRQTVRPITFKYVLCARLYCLQQCSSDLFSSHTLVVFLSSGPAVRFSSFSHGEPTPPPLIGQHTVQVLQHTLSYSDDVIKTLLESRVVAQNEVSWLAERGARSQEKWNPWQQWRRDWSEQLSTADIF